MKPGKALQRTIAAVAALAGLAAWPAGAGAVIVVGSDLSDPPITITQACAPAPAPCTYLPLFVDVGNAYPVKSPATGTVTALKIRSGSADTVTFRLGSYGKGKMTAKGAGTGPTVVLPGPGIHTFPASVPIKYGAYVGIDTSSTTALGNLPCSGLGTTYHFNPVLADGGSLQPVDANSICELMVQAVIDPSSVISIAKAPLKVKGASASLTVKVPGPGKLSLKGKGVAPRSASGGTAVASQKVKKAGKAVLKITPRGKTKSKLARGASAKVKVKLTFSPTGGTPGTLKRTLKLKP